MLTIVATRCEGTCVESHELRQQEQSDLRSLWPIFARALKSNGRVYTFVSRKKILSAASIVAPIELEAIIKTIKPRLLIHAAPLVVALLEFKREKFPF